MKTSIIVISFIISICASFYMGVQLGADQYYLGSAQYRMMTHFGYLKMANRGDIEQIKSYSNSNIDYELIDHTAWQDSKFRWLLPAMQTDDDKYGKAVALYRFKNPYQHKLPDLSNFPETEKIQFQKQFQNNQNKINQAYERYRE